MYLAVYSRSVQYRHHLFVPLERSYRGWIREAYGTRRHVVYGRRTVAEGIAADPGLASRYLLRSGHRDNSSKCWTSGRKCENDSLWTVVGLYLACWSRKLRVATSGARYKPVWATGRCLAALTNDTSRCCYAGCPAAVRQITWQRVSGEENL